MRRKMEGRELREDEEVEREKK
jgi:hypothetical protein